MNFAAGTLRIRLGVTGHRVLKDPEALAQKVREVLTSRICELIDRDISQEKGGISKAFIILTSLAEGADRLVAWEALKIPNSEIEVVLPFAKGDYLKDFKTEQSRQEFEKLYQKAINPIELKVQLFTERLSPTYLTEIRNKAYEDVGRFVVTHCDVLIALWDGKPSRGRGGTSEIVAFARENERPLIVISTDDTLRVTVERGRGLNRLILHSQNKSLKCS
jgi:hypothetical protein